jgi:hypothetical protein
MVMVTVNLIISLTGVPAVMVAVKATISINIMQIVLFTHM